MTGRELHSMLRKLASYPQDRIRGTFEKLVLDYRLRGQYMPADVKALWIEIAAGLPSFAKFNPYHDELGRFTFGSGGSDDDSDDIDDPPIQPVYPIETALMFLFGGKAVGAAEEALGSAEGIGTAAEDGANIANSVGTDSTDVELTDHAALRLDERGIATEQTQEAIQTAIQTGSVASQIGKYGTPQIVYTGSNGITVIVETAGSNAGKIITSYRH